MRILAKTKKVGISGRFGARFGGQIRSAWRDIMEKQKGIQKCPKCETKNRNTRVSIGVWQCRRCGAKYTGGAWDSTTPRGKEGQRVAIRISREMAEAEKAEKQKAQQQLAK